jgi:hypothetical protein
MPSVIHRSALMQSRKVALTSQDFVEQGNGLVQVALGYTAAASDAASVLPLFRVDSQPPINPSMISLNGLQSQKLYMTTFTSSQQNGLLQINASYVGASLNALRKPMIFDSLERRTFSLEVPAYRTATLGSFEADLLQIEPLDSRVITDFYAIHAYLRKEEHQVAVVAKEAIEYFEPPVITTSLRDGLLMGATFTARYVGSDFRADRYSGVTERFGDARISPYSSIRYSDLQERFNQKGDKKLPGFAFRSMTAMEILQALASSTSDFKGAAGFSVNNTGGKIEHVTPTVRLMSNLYELQVNFSPIYAKYGFFVK